MSVFVDGYEIDAALSEDHDLEAQVTPYPVEKGGNNADHIIPRPRRYRLEGIVSNTPFGPLAQRREELNVINGESFIFPSDEAYAFLENLHSVRREPVTVKTSLKTYENMVLETLSIPTSIKEGDALRFVGIFVQITIATNERSTVLVTDNRAKKKTSRGHKSTSPGPTLQEVADANQITVDQFLKQLSPPQGVENISRLNGNATTPGAGGSF